MNMQIPSHFPSCYFAAYCAVLIAHFSYAFYLIRGGRVSLAVGNISKPAPILISLLILNSFSLTAFLIPNHIWIWFNFGFHVALTIDEIIRMKKVPLRWPFMLNHVLFVIILALYGYSV